MRAQIEDGDFAFARVIHQHRRADDFLPRRVFRNARCKWNGKSEEEKGAIHGEKFSKLKNAARIDVARRFLWF
jgi:hypothetical protein